MAVGYGQSWVSHTNSSSTNQASFNVFTSATVNACRGAIVYVYTVAGTDNGSSVTWGGVSMTAIPYTASDTDTEPGTVKAYWLANPATGTVTCTVSRTNNATAMSAFATTVTSDWTPEVYTSGIVTQGGSSQNTAATTSGTGTGASGPINVDDGSPGTSSMRFVFYHTGASNPLAADSTTTTRDQTNDLGLYGAAIYHETTAGQGSRSVGTATGTTDDRAAIYLPVREKPPTSSSFTANAIIRTTFTPTGPNADAITKRTQSGVFYIGNNDGTGGAVIAISSTTYTFTDKKADAVLRKTFEPTTTANAVLLASSGTKTFLAEAVLLKAFDGSTKADAVLFRTFSHTPKADAVLLHLGMPGSAGANAVIFRNSGTLAFSVAAIVLKTTSDTPRADAIVKKTIASDTANADAVIQASIGGSFYASSITTWTVEPHFHVDYQWYIPTSGPTWVSPPDGASITSTPVLVFLMPDISKDMHFHIQLDKTSGFNGGDLRDIKSNHDTSGWEYWNGSGWAAIPSSGVPQAYAGNEARYTISVPLSAGTWYRRVRAG